MSFSTREALDAEYKQRHAALEARYYTNHEIEKAEFDRLHGELAAWHSAECLKQGDPLAYRVRWEETVNGFVNVLKQHYAKGEISKDAMLQALSDVMEAWKTDLAAANLPTFPVSAKNRAIRVLVKAWDDYTAQTIDEDTWVDICTAEKQRFHDSVKS